MFKKIYIVYILAFFALLEIGLRITGPFKVYSETLGGKYRSYWGFEHKGHYKILPKSKRVTYSQKEFDVDYTTNQLGMRNREISMVPADGTLRILCLGDSFTQGDGATNGNSFPRQLERILNNEMETMQFEVVNAGSSGSDIIYSEKLLVEVAYQLQPDLVLITTNDSDIEDIIQRGGVERFQTNNSTKFKDGPWYEDLYAKSHVVRFFTHSIFRKSQLFLSPKAEKEATLEANETVVASMHRLLNFCDDKDIEIRFVIHPYPGNIKKVVQGEAAEMKITAHLDGYTYDLSNFLTDTLTQLNYDKYAWPLNGHFNDNGYKIMAERIFDEILRDSLL